MALPKIAQSAATIGFVFPVLVAGYLRFRNSARNSSALRVLVAASGFSGPLAFEISDVGQAGKGVSGNNVRHIQ